MYLYNSLEYDVLSKNGISVFSLPGDTTIITHLCMVMDDNDRDILAEKRCKLLVLIKSSRLLVESQPAIQLFIGYALLKLEFITLEFVIVK